MKVRYGPILEKDPTLEKDKGI